ncbi:MAG: acetyl CoA synthetase subunit alpha [Verrucomicrobiaceae bacterium]|nr:acetyl CoA synthetase subunit alpha [Verrucomicrobiaceae bacterium]
MKIKARQEPAKNERAHDILKRTRNNPLEAFFRPRTVALIGASEVPHSVGAALAGNLLSFGEGFFPVNPKRATVLGRPAFASIGDVPKQVDLAVIATPAASVAGIVRECVEAGVSAAVIISAGFKETGAEGQALEQQVLQEGVRGNLRLLGPNCLGVMSPHVGLNATFAAHMAEKGSVAFLSQSGALCTAILDWSRRERVGFSAFVSTGSMLDVEWGDLIDWLGDDPHTKSILIYMESIGDPRAFLSAAREVALTKPVIVIKVGHTEAAARAAASHTGALTGSDAVLDAAFRRAGVLRVSRIEELFDMAEVLSKQPRPRGPRLAIVTNAGGPGALATDFLVTSGGVLADLSKATLDELNTLLPDHWSHANPIDILGDAREDRFARALAIAAQDPHTDCTLVILTPQAMTDPSACAAAIAPAAEAQNKPVLASWMGGADVEEGRRILNEAGIPTFDYPDRAARAFALMWQRELALRGLYETPALTGPNVKRAETEAVAEIIAAALKAGTTLLSKSDCNRILEAYHLPTQKVITATTVGQAVKAAQRLGFPVVVKLHSATITHKTEVGGVKLDLRDEAAVRLAWQQIKSGVPAPDFLGVTVEAMVSVRDGYELIVGSSQDPQFGPVLLFGAGGQLVEVFKDYELGLPPLTATLARRMVERTRISTALHGVRGRPALDLAALDQLLVRFSELIAGQPRIKEMEINPLLATAQGFVALDVRILLHGPEIADADLPKLVIKPYPAQYVEDWSLPDGTPVVIRPIRPEDEPMMVDFHHHLSERSVYHRWFNAFGLDQRIAHDRLARICFIDYDREMALVVERNTGHGGTEIIAVGRLSRLRGVNAAEFSITISDPWQRHGLGSALMQRLVNIGRAEGLDRITAEILPENAGMKALARKTGFTVHYDALKGECHAEILL